MVHTASFAMSVSGKTTSMKQAPEVLTIRIRFQSGVNENPKPAREKKNHYRKVREIGDCTQVALN